MKHVLIALSVALAAAGCASSGNEVLKDATAESMDEILSVGMDKSEVREALGDPMAVSFTDSGNEIWNYTFTEAQMTAQSFIPFASMLSSGMDGTQKQLAIFFDQGGTLQRFSMTESDVQSRSGIMN
ncbi:MAG: outer membrane protein assembly factor BamE [Pseudomonadota bacterium]